MKKAFTLIELLVVIAIIAILAAILFPVFAQAKEAAKKTQAISNTKQMGTATLIYAADYDDTFPNAVTQRADGSWRYNVATPANLDPVLTVAAWTTPDLRNAAGSYWASAIQPYMKNWQLNELPGGRPWNIFNEAYAAGAPRFTLTYNGFMHNLSATAVNNSSSAVLFWPGGGQDTSIGRARTNPALNCGTGPTCAFNPGGPPGTWPGPFGTSGGVTMGNGGGSFWLYARSAPVVRTDSSARIFRMGSRVNTGGTVPEPGNIWNDPFALVSPQGGFGTAPTNAVWYVCTSTGVTAAGSSYWCFFRPDREQ
jgi:prepilin-type N-terminal cleavage/methylation domain-containing protein